MRQEIRARSRYDLFRLAIRRDICFARLILLPRELLLSYFANFLFARDDRFVDVSFPRELARLIKNLDEGARDGAVYGIAIASNLLGEPVRPAREPEK